MDKEIFKKYFDKIYKNNRETFYKELENDLLNSNKKFIITANPETIMRAEFECKELKEAFFSDKTCVVADGIGVLKGARELGIEIPETILGVSTVQELFKMCSENKKSIFLFGAKNDVLSQLVIKIKKDYSGAEVVGAVDGYIEDKENVFNEILEKKPDVILVALGIPMQEKLIFNNLDKFEKGIFIGVGGSFDVLSGSKKGAPEFFKKTNLEWLYRITTEPKRLKRFFKYNIKYWRLVKKEKKIKK